MGRMNAIDCHACEQMTIGGELGAAGGARIGHFSNRSPELVICYKRAIPL